MSYIQCRHIESLVSLATTKNVYDFCYSTQSFLEKNNTQDGVRACVFRADDDFNNLDSTPAVRHVPSKKQTEKKEEAAPYVH